MARPKGGLYNVRDSTPIALRVPNELLAQAHERCGGKAALTEWLRNHLRIACAIPLDFDAGYYEGRAAGWAEANKQFRSRMAGVFDKP